MKTIQTYCKAINRIRLKWSFYIVDANADNFLYSVWICGVRVGMRPPFSITLLSVVFTGFPRTIAAAAISVAVINALLLLPLIFLVNLEARLMRTADRRAE